MALFRKYDLWSIQEGLDALIDYDVNGNEKESIYWDFYSDQIRELSIIAADMSEELYSLKSTLWREMPFKQIEFCGEDECEQTAIAWWNTAACMFSDIDMTTLLENENRYGMDDWEQGKEKEKRIRALEKLTKKQFMTLNTLVVGFITRYLELVGAHDVITGCIRELDYHQSAVQTKEGVNLPDVAYL